MASGPAPIIAVGTLSGNLPTGAGAMTKGSSPLAPGQSPFSTVMLNQSNAVTGMTFTPFSAPKVTPDGASAAATQAALLLAQEQSRS